MERAISDSTLQDAVDQAGSHADFDPDLSSAVEAIKQTFAQVLILHGTEDWLVPAYHAMRLYSAGRSHSRLILLPRMGHVSIWFDVKGEVADETRDWFAKNLNPTRAR